MIKKMDKIFKENNKQYLDRPVVSRDDVVSDAVEKCLDLMYRASYPSITLDEYKGQHKGMTDDEKNNSQLFNAHYLPEKTYNAIRGDIIDAYGFTPELPGTVKLLKDYFKCPVVETWVKDEDGTGHKGYDNLEPMDDETYKTVEKFLDMANGFFRWDRDLSVFSFNVANYSPCSNRDTVEKWWHEHGEPDFKLPPDEYWTDTWEEDADFEVEED